ncbi:hypothetical protein N0V82_007586 [Gnomoniopsis sp. IMI 355080]|nr:hypothetical protein N0V82_007586 [Gnomoniopsis sp. IMI 355080]
MTAAVLPTVRDQNGPPKPTIHPSFYIAGWIFFSSVTIIFNKYLLSDLDFHFPAILTCWHLFFASIVTQILARTTSLLDNRKDVEMDVRTYVRAIVPIGVLYSASLVCSNQAYLYLSVALIQMLKASAPAAVLLLSWLFGLATPNIAVFLNVVVIVFGVAVASYGEVHIVWLGFLFQAGGIVAEALRLIMIQILLGGDGKHAMDPLVSLYYYAPVCAVMNLMIAFATEWNTFEMAFVWKAGIVVLVGNAAVAFMLNVASVMLIGKTSGLVMTLCGVLKNILLVVASMLIWGTIVGGLQAFGFSIALVGLVYYSIGYDGFATFGSSIAAWFSGFRHVAQDENEDEEDQESEQGLLDDSDDTEMELKPMEV